MKENVGHMDRGVRSFIAPALLALGYRWLIKRHKHGAGLATMIAGALIAETALTKTCPMNKALGINTAD
jgi:hypothetical protein